MKALRLIPLLLIGATAYAQNVNFSNTIPAAPTGGVNLNWQHDASTPVNISAYIPSFSTIVSLWGSGACTSGFLKFDGTCAAGTSTITSVFGRLGVVVPQPGDYSVGQVTGAAPLASPALTGSPTAPTQTTGDNTTKIATDAFVLANAGAGSGIISSGAQNAIPYYVTSPTGTTLGPSNITVGAGGNSIQVPSAVAVGPSIVGNTFTMTPLATIPASWIFDMTSPATALASIAGSSSLVAGTNVTVTGVWPNQTVNSTGGSGSSITPVVVALPSGSPILAGLCSAVFTASMPGVIANVGSTAGTRFNYSFVGDTSGVVGYGSSGSLNLVSWPTTNQFNGKICNPTSVNITPGAASMNLGAQ